MNGDQPSILELPWRPIQQLPAASMIITGYPDSAQEIIAIDEIENGSKKA